MLRKLLALGLSMTLLLCMIPGGAMAQGTYESNQNMLEDSMLLLAGDDPDYWTDNYAGALQTDGSAQLKATGVESYSQANPRQHLGELIRRGIDVSQWQKEIDWAAVAASGVEFAIIRVAFRGYGKGALADDTYFKTNLKEAKANGLKVGAYIFSQAITTDEAIEEARYLMDKIQGYEIDLPLVIDYEFAGGTEGRLYTANLSRQEGTNICNAFCAEVESRGYDSMVYANPSMLGNKLYPEQLGRLWLAHYTKETNYQGDYEYWQFTSSGLIPGISGAVDLNFWFDSGLPFRDVKRNDWFFDATAWAHENGIINGLTTTSFGPNDTAQRGQVITMIYRFMGQPDITDDTPLPFEDLTEEYYQNAIRWGTLNGVVRGTGETTFSPVAFTERQMLVTMLYRLCREPKSEQSLEAFSDENRVEDYAKAAIAWAVENGIVQGDRDLSGVARLRPTDPCSRAEVAAILMRYASYLEEHPIEEEPEEKPDEKPDEKPEENPDPTDPPEKEPGDQPDAAG